MKRSFMDHFSNSVVRYTGSSYAFTVACGLVFVWLITGPYFHYSTNWQLVINTGTTIITFLMVFLIQKAQNKDSVALQIKLNELIAASKIASNRLIDVEDLSEEELQLIRGFYVKLSQLAKQTGHLHKTFSIDAAHSKHASQSPELGAETLEILEEAIEEDMMKQ
ncbi:MAG: low affinity iron permease family protein [Candidatus Absconditabacterales bacterium]